MSGLCNNRGPTIRQVAALPFRQVDGITQVLLVTSRETRRWVLPKGNIDRGMTPAQAAAQEAVEEAGVRGVLIGAPVGTYRYRKTRLPGWSRLIEVSVHPIAVTEELSTWKEQHQRERRWFSPGEAADLVQEPELKTLLRTFRV